MGNASSSSQSSEEEEEIAVAPQSEEPQQQQTSAVPSTPAQNPLFDDGVYYNEKEPRMTAWVCLLASSIIALTSVLGSVGGEWTSGAWVLLVMIISIAISIFSLLFYVFCKHHYVGKVWGEGVASYLLLLFWIGGLAVCMNPARQLAVTKTEFGLNIVLNANLYFSMWFGFLCMMYIVASWTMACWTKAAEVITAITGRLKKWWWLFVISIVLLVSAAQFHYTQDCANGGKTNLSVNACKSNAFAVALGAWACVLTLIAIILSHIGKIHFYVESTFSIILFIFYTAGVAVITYNEGSGIAIGNLYFSTWSGFVITIFLCLDCFYEYKERRAAKRAANPPKKKRSKRHHKSKAKSKATPTQQAAEPIAASQPKQQSVPPSRVSSMRSSIDEAEFCDARDDLELTL